VKRLVKIVLLGWLLGELYARGGREVLFGPETPDESRELEIIRRWITVPPPTIRHTFTDTAARRCVGADLVRDGDVIGHVLEAERDERGWLVVRYEAERVKLGWPINVAVSQAELVVARAVGVFAIEMS
jgi:hypothetical protein